jgi:DNA-binding NarL/FixJ family response regulator
MDQNNLSSGRSCAGLGILPADHHALLGEGVASLVAIEPDMVMAQASTGREAIEQFRRHRPDVTLMDLQMPDTSGVEAIIAIRSEFSNARIIVLTTYSGDVQVDASAQSARVPAEGNVHTDLLNTIRCGACGAKAVRLRSRPSWPCTAPTTN